MSSEKLNVNTCKLKIYFNSIYIKAARVRERERERQREREKERDRQTDRAK